MKLENIDRILIFREDANGRVLSLRELRARYGINPDGTNFYYGVNSANVTDSSGTASALNPTHRAFLDGMISALKSSAEDEKTLVLGLEPLEPPDPYTYVAANLDLIGRLAADLNGYQEQARSFGKRLMTVIRYASEMNDRGQIQGRDPSGYRDTFIQVRKIFTNTAPSVLFSFSPALRADLPEELIGQYWPGDQYVDVVGGTWYIGGPNQRASSIAHMQAYFLHRVGSGKSFALSEVGGHNGSDAGNDAVLQDMLHELEALQMRSISFKYATIFLQGVWGTDATLAFLSATAAAPPAS